MNLNLIQLAKGSALVGSGLLFESVVRIILGIFLAQALGPEKLGFYSIGISVALVSTFISMIGFGEGLVRFIPVYTSKKDNSGLAGLLRMSIFIPLLFSLMIACVIFFGARFLAEILFSQPDLQAILKASAVLIPVWVLEISGARTLQGGQYLYHFTLSKNICLPSSRLIGMFLLAITGFLYPKTAVYIFGFSLLTAAVLNLFWAGSKYFTRLKKAVPRYDFSNILRFTLPIYASHILLVAGPSLQLLLIGMLGTSKDVGIFAPIYDFMLFSVIVYNAVSMAGSPKIAMLHTQKRFMELNHFYKTASRWIFTISLPIFLVSFLFAEPLLLFLGRDFIPGINALRLMSIAGLIDISLKMSNPLLTMTGHSKIRLINTVFLYGVMFGCDYFLIPLLGVSGAALALAIASITTAIVLFMQTKLLFGVHPFSPAHLKPLLSGLFAGAGSLLIGEMLHQFPYWVQATASIASLPAIYLTSLILMKISPEDKEIVQYLLSRSILRFKSGKAKDNP